MHLLWKASRWRVEPLCMTQRHSGGGRQPSNISSLQWKDEVMPFPGTEITALTPKSLAALTPSLPQTVKFPGWMMHVRACKQYIFRFIKAIFNAMRFDGDPFRTCQCEKEDRKAEGFQILHFYGPFSDGITAMKGLILGKCLKARSDAH